MRGIETNGGRASRQPGFGKRLCKVAAGQPHSSVVADRPAGQATAPPVSPSLPFAGTGKRCAARDITTSVNGASQDRLIWVEGSSDKT